MTRLPDLERQLLEAARKFDRPRHRRWRIAAIGSGTTLALAATAFGATQLLPEGDAVPSAPSVERLHLPTMKPGSSHLLSLRTADPDGGPPWGLVVARSANGRQFCAQIGRVQKGRLGVVGRDGAFKNDGRFHPLDTDSSQGETCTIVASTGELQIGSGDGPPIPASGYTGSLSGSAGGCRENVPDSSIPPETLERLREVPICADSSLRVVKYGLAGRDARRVEYAGHEFRPDPGENGAYLFVIRPTGHPATLTIVYTDGRVCRSTFPSRAPRPGARIPRPCS